PPPPPRARTSGRGHPGDGNIHYNITRGRDDDDAAIEEKRQAIHNAVHDLVMELQGTFSAEHGIGRTKVKEWQRHVSLVERQMMLGMKKTLDPKGILNPGVLLQDG
ncbi:MAG: FAD-linked oxidase C-terminal domain-containing protein, partial [Pseudomonadota bacterium]